MKRLARSRLAFVRDAFAWRRSDQDSGTSAAGSFVYGVIPALIGATRLPAFAIDIPLTASFAGRRPVLVVMATRARQYAGTARTERRLVREAGNGSEEALGGCSRCTGLEPIVPHI